MPLVADVFAVAQNKFLIFADTDRRISGFVDGERFAVQTEIDSDVCDVERVGDGKIVFEVYIYRFCCVVARSANRRTAVPCLPCDAAKLFVVLFTVCRAARIVPVRARCGFVRLNR